jgi:hypothetical protein
VAGGRSRTIEPTDCDEPGLTVSVCGYPAPSSLSQAARYVASEHLTRPLHTRVIGHPHGRYGEASQGDTVMMPRRCPRDAGFGKDQMWA